jgi:hypothetical protein
LSSYTKSTNFATKDTLTSGDPLKIVRGTEINTEFDNIQTAVNSKSDTASPTFTGTVTIPTASVSSTTDSSSVSTGSIITAGGVGVAKALYVGTTANVAGAVTLQSALSVTGVTTVQAGTAAAPAITTTGDTNTGIFFPAADTIAFSEGGVEAMRIDSSGNVGIGTSSPDAKLEVTIGDNNGINIEQSGSSQTGYLTFRDSDGGLDGRVSYDHSNNSMRFTTATTERMRIDSSGNLLVGTTSATSSGFLQITASSVKYGLVSRASTTNSSAAGFFNSSGTEVGSINTTGSATSYVTSSDYRLKEAIAPMTGALAKVALLKPCVYKWKVDGSDGQGFIAHELAEVEAGCVTGEKDAVDADGNPKYQGIDTSFLVATLTAAIQEQQAIITSLTDRITALENK